MGRPPKIKKELLDRPNQIYLPIANLNHTTTNTTTTTTTNNNNFNLNDDRTNLTTLNRSSAIPSSSSVPEYPTLKVQTLQQQQQQQRQSNPNECSGLYGMENDMCRGFKGDGSPSESLHHDLNGPNRLYANMKYANPTNASSPHLSPLQYTKLRGPDQIPSPNENILLNQDENVYSPNFYAGYSIPTSPDAMQPREFGAHKLDAERRFGTYRHDEKPFLYDSKEHHPDFPFENNFDRYSRQPRQNTTNDRIIFGSEPFDYYDHECNDRKLQTIQHQYAVQQHLAQQHQFRMRIKETNSIVNDNNNNSNDRSYDNELDGNNDLEKTDPNEFERKKSITTSEFNSGNNDNKNLMPITNCKSEAINEYHQMQTKNHLQQQLKPRMHMLQDTMTGSCMNDINFKKLNTEMPDDDCDDNNESHVNL